MKIIKVAIVLIILILTNVVYAQEKEYSTQIPDYSSWKLKSFPVAFNKSGAINLTFKIYYTENDAIQIWVDKYGKERVLTIQYSYKNLFGSSTINFYRIDDQWVLSRGFDREPIKSDALVKAQQSLINDLGGKNNFSEAISKLVFAMYQTY